MYNPKALPHGYTKRDALCFFAKEKQIVISELKLDKENSFLKNCLAVIEENIALIESYSDDWRFIINYESGTNSCS
jgi:hypothetical protein